MNEMELWEAYLLCDNLAYIDRNLWDAARMITYITAQANSTKKLNPSDIIEFAWDKKQDQKPEQYLSADDVNKKIEAFKKRINYNGE